jgi:formamidopyrimidine-DNA glycosylase
VKLFQFSALKTVLPPLDTIFGRPLDGVGRRGKYMLWNFGDTRLAMHLSQAGRIEFEDPPKTTKPQGAVARFRFEGRPSILFKEFGRERKAGIWVLAADDPGPMEGLGPEATSDEFAEWVRTAADRRRIHTILRDQRTVAGIGRGHADDVLHRAKMSPTRSLASLDDEGREVLLAAILADLDEKLALEREREGGLPPKLGEHWKIHARWGTPCPDCGTQLARISYEGYEISYCPTCQTGGKVLADRRLSRLLK